MKVSFWVVVEAKRNYYDRTKVQSLNARMIRQNKPRLEPDDIGVKVTLDIDPRAFSEPIYSVDATVPPEMIVPGPALIIEEPPLEEEVTA